MNKKTPFFQWEFTLPALIFIAAVLWLLWGIIESCGRVVYPIDDPYIHLAMARHLVQDGFFGVSLNGFSASSSSPLWTVILAFCFRILGPQDWVPLVINFLASLVLLYLVYRIASRMVENRYLVFLFLIAFIFAIPLITQCFTGMEHPLHILFVLLLIQQILHQETDQYDSMIVLFSALAVMLRYESLFVAAPLGLILVMQSHWKRLICLVAGMWLPVVLLGCLYLSQGWYFFPNSIIVKSAISTHEASLFLGIIDRLYNQIYTNPHIAVLFVVSAAIMVGNLREQKWYQQPRAVWLFIFLVTTVLHCATASMGWFFRYESYLLATGLLGIVPSIHDLVQSFIARSYIWKDYAITTPVGILIFCLLIAPLHTQFLSIQKIVPGAKNIYHQQYQMGRFLKTYYNEETVVANDIGAINYLANIYCLDIMGLGSMEPLKAKARGRLSPEFIDAWARLKNANIAVTYASWWKGAVPSTWILVGTWTVPEKVTVSDRTVSFYALNGDEAQRIASNLLAFKTNLPNDVDVRLYFP